MDHIEQAAETYNIPADVLRNAILRESLDNWENNDRIVDIPSRDDSILPYIGVFKGTQERYAPGVDFDALRGDRQGQVNLLARVMVGVKNEYGIPKWEHVAQFMYHGIPPQITGSV
jgi:hypothetical protein